MSIEPVALGAIEPEATLKDCERAYQEVERNANIGRGIILRHVRDHGLYREADFDTFEKYVELRVGIMRAHAYRLIDLADTVAALSPIGDTPEITNEGQARAIKPVLRDHGPEVAAEVLRDAAAVGSLTARAIEDAKQRHRLTAPVQHDEPVEVLTEQEWKAQQGIVSSDPDPDDFIPPQTKFELSFWRHMDGAHELVTDLDYPHHFNEQMTRRLLDLIDTLARKQDALNARGLRVVNGGKQ